MIRPKYHQSSLQAFLKCGKLYEFRYIMGLRTPPKAALTVGRAVDEAVNLNMTRKVQTGEYAPVEEVLDFTADTFAREAADTEWGEDKPDEQKDMAIRLSKLHAEAVAPTIEPATVQEEFTLETDAGYDIGGTLDMTDAQGRIRDTKTMKRGPTTHEVNRAFQPAVYDFAYQALRGKPSTGFVFDILVKPTKTIDVESRTVEGKVTPLDHEWIFNAIDSVHRSIQAGAFPPAPEGSWYCSEKWCGFWNQCKGRKAK